MGAAEAGSRAGRWGARSPSREERCLVERWGARAPAQRQAVRPRGPRPREEWKAAVL